MGRVGGWWTVRRSIRAPRARCLAFAARWRLQRLAEIQAHVDRMRAVGDLAAMLTDSEEFIELDGFAASHADINTGERA